MRPTTSPVAIWAGMIVLYVVWGTTYLGMAVTIETIPPFVMTALRFATAGLVLGAFAVLHARGSIPRPTRRQLIDSAIVGTALVAIGNALVGWGEQTVPSGIAAILIALMPAWVAVFGRIFFRDRLPAVVLVGIAIGIVGVVVLAWPTTGGGGSLEPAGLVALILSPIGWSLGSLYAARRATLPSPPLFATGLQMLFGAGAATLLATVTGEWARFDPATVSDRSLVGLVYLIVVGSLIGYTTYGWLLRKAPLSRVSTYTYINPIVALVLGAIVLNEPITPRAIVASVVIIVAVVLIVTARGRLPGPSVARESADRRRAVSPRPAPSERRVEPAPSRSASG